MLTFSTGGLFFYIKNSKNDIMLYINSNNKLMSFHVIKATDNAIDNKINTLIIFSIIDHVFFSLY